MYILQHRIFFYFVVASFLATVMTNSGVAETETSVDERAAAERIFTLKALPLLNHKCLGCHGSDADDIKGEFDVRSIDSLLNGGESGEPAIVVGKPEESPLFHAIQWDGLEMPPKENDRLTKNEIELFRIWIAAGAPWPAPEEQTRIRNIERSVVENEDGLIVSTSGGLSDDWTYRRYQPDEIWAFQPVKSKAELTNVSNAEFELRNPVDHFIGEKLKSKGVEAAKRADARTLIRRATLDLTGLPPTPREIATFRKAWEVDAGQAWSDLIDRLLAVDAYGERWGQHWLDVARYADTAGFSNDYERSNAWRYRDYVIRSFNSDKPYNEFVVEQLAGDEIEAMRQDEKKHDDLKAIHARSLDVPSSELIVATGFLRMGPWGTAMISRDEARQIFLDDLVHNVGQTFLSLPMRCCKCHDHKFDPIPTRDYYGMYAAFATTQPAEIPAPFLEEENVRGFEQYREHVNKLWKLADDDRIRLVNKREAAAKQWYAEHDLPYKNEQDRRNDPEDKKPPRHVGLDHVDEGTLKVREQDEWIWNRRKERYEPLAQSVYNGPDYNYNGRKLRRQENFDRSWRPESFILAGGALTSKLQAVMPSALSATLVQVSVPEDLDGRRLSLAKWIADPKNPLTARSFVNRVWQYHFGQGIVRTPNNFGVKGSKPTHPELLDWLTADFVEHGWKVKRLHRLIMTSATYQQSSQHAMQEKLDEVDPHNDLLARFLPRRLTAEELRDSMLLMTGELNLEVGGVPIMPEINMEVALQPRMIQFSIAPAHQPSRTPAERNRRSIYAYRVRGQADPFLEVLNLPNPNESCQSRVTSAVTPQAFTLMNSDVVTDRSIAFALRLQKENQGKGEAQQIRRAFRIAFGRKPNASELESLLNYLTEMKQYHNQNKPQEVKYPTEITRSLVEEFSGEPFEYTESLPIFEDYVPDAKSWSVGASTRALADVCLLLFNSNEFVYVY